MKYIVRFSFAVLAICITFSCAHDGRDGAPGPAGVDGTNGQDGESAYLFEFTGITFTPADKYEHYLDFPENFLYNTDKVLVYFLWETDNQLDVWRLLPQTVLTDSTTLIYNYDFTVENIRLFVNANFDLKSIDSSTLGTWVARAVVVPANFLPERTSVDYTNYDEVIKHYGLENTTPQKIPRKE